MLKSNALSLKELRVVQLSTKLSVSVRCSALLLRAIALEKMAKREQKKHAKVAVFCQLLFTLVWLIK